MKKKVFHASILFLFCVCLFGGSWAQDRQDAPPRRIVGTGSTVAVTPAQPFTLSPEKQKRSDSFVLVWRTIRDNYFDPTFGNLNWEAIRKEFEPRILAATSDQEFYSLLDEMIGRLNKSHFAIIRPDVFKTINLAKRQAKQRGGLASRERRGEEDTVDLDDPSEDDAADLEPALDEHSTFGLGVDLRIIDEKFVISRVEKNSAAEYHGLKPGYIIEKVNGVSLSDMLRRIDLLSGTVRDGRLYLPLEVVKWFLDGKEDTYANLTYVDETDTPKDIKILRERLPGQSVSIGKNLPVQNLDFQSRSLNDEVGYISFNIFALPVVGKFCDALTEFKNKKGIIIDLRGNLGGLLGTMVGLGGMLTDSKVDLGTQIFREGSERLMALSKAKHFNGQVVLLIDNQSVSSAEVFAAALKENSRAILVGTRSAGAALPASSVKLPTGAVLMYPIANFKTKNGNLIEGKGVEPNFSVSLTRKELLAGHDPQLDEAIQLIRQNAGFPKADMPRLSVATGQLPPPPVAKTSPKLSSLGTGRVDLPPPPMARPSTSLKDADSVRIIKEFLDLIGGADALTSMKSYQMKGKTRLKVRTFEIDFDFSSLRDGSEKYGEIMNAPETGEIREIYNGKNSFVQADYGMEMDIPFAGEVSHVEIFAPLFTLARPDTLTSLSYKGTFDRSGRKTHVIEAVARDGSEVALAFDVETKMLVSFSQRYSTISFGDYKKVGDLTLPFMIEREPVMKIQLDEIKVNPALDPGLFNKKQNCFDIAN